MLIPHERKHQGLKEMGYLFSRIFLKSFHFCSRNWNTNNSRLLLTWGSFKGSLQFFKLIGCKSCARLLFLGRFTIGLILVLVIVFVTNIVGRFLLVSAIRFFGSRHGSSCSSDHTGFHYGHSPTIIPQSHNFFCIRQNDNYLANKLGSNRGHHLSKYKKESTFAYRLQTLQHWMMT